MDGWGLIGLEIAVIVAGAAVLLLGQWARDAEQRRQLGYGAILVLAAVFAASFVVLAEGPRFAFGKIYVMDELALFFKRLFLLAAIFTLLMAVELADQLGAAAEYYALTLFALAGMMFAASAHSFVLLYVSLELITVCFYVLAGFRRDLPKSLEAGVKYLVIGALAGGFMVFGIALIYGATGTLDFQELAQRASDPGADRLLLLGLFLAAIGLGFKLAAAPFHVWAPDVYQGAPPSTAAFLAVGSTGAGLVLLIRLLHTALPGLAVQWRPALALVGCVSVLFGVLCAVPQRSLSRMMGYSSVANAGFILLALSAGGADGVAAALFYMAAYLFGVMGAFSALTAAERAGSLENAPMLEGLRRRFPLLGLAAMASMVSLAGVPPTGGFFGKLTLFKALFGELGAGAWVGRTIALGLLGTAIALYFYLKVVQAVCLEEDLPKASGPGPSRAVNAAAAFCVAGVLWLGVWPGSMMNLAYYAAHALGL